MRVRVRQGAVAQQRIIQRDSVTVAALWCRHLIDAATATLYAADATMSARAFAREETCDIVCRAEARRSRLLLLMMRLARCCADFIILILP